MVARLDNIPSLRAVHINHGLSEDADDWEEHCRRECAARGIELRCDRVEVVADGRGPEAAAREARYRVFTDCLAPGEALLLAHHLDDHVETFFLRLLRGAGTAGLSGMPAQRPLGAGVLVRPLLEMPRSALKSYALDRGLKWCEDTSNTDESLDRNYLRRQVLPRLAARWPGYRESVAGAADAIAAAESLLVTGDAALMADAGGSCFGEPTVALSDDRPPAVQARLLRYWLSGRGLALPGRRALEAFVAQCGEVAPANQAQLTGPGYLLARHDGHVHLSVATAELPANDSRTRGAISVGTRSRRVGSP